MNLESSLQELIKKPKSMVGEDGKSHPVLWYSDHLKAAIKWLIDRYNDGTLQVVGYNEEEEATRKKLERHSMRRGKELDSKGYLQQSEFIRQTGFSEKMTDKISRLSGARRKVGYNVYIDVNKFFNYLDNETHEFDGEALVNLTKAAQLLRLKPKEVKKLIDDKKIKVDEKFLPYRQYKIYKSSIVEYLRSIERSEDGENSSSIE